MGVANVMIYAKFCFMCRGLIFAKEGVEASSIRSCHGRYNVAYSANAQARDKPRQATLIDGLETETSRSRDVSRRIHGLVGRNICYRLGLVIQGLGSRLGLGRLGLEPMSYFPLSRKEKHVTTRP
jgi:hypothetical protein